MDVKRYLLKHLYEYSSDKNFKIKQDSGWGVHWFSVECMQQESWRITVECYPVRYGIDEKGKPCSMLAFSFYSQS